MTDTTTDRLSVLIHLVQPERPRFNHAINGMLLQHLADASERSLLRRVPRYENTATTLRALAVEEFTEAVRHGFISC